MLVRLIPAGVVIVTVGLVLAEIWTRVGPVLEALRHAAP